MASKHPHQKAAPVFFLLKQPRSGVAAVALAETATVQQDRPLAWQAWYLRAVGGARRWPKRQLCHRAALALAWQAWHLRTVGGGDGAGRNGNRAALALTWLAWHLLAVGRGASLAEVAIV